MQIKDPPILDFFFQRNGLFKHLHLQKLEVLNTNIYNILDFFYVHIFIVQVDHQ